MSRAVRLALLGGLLVSPLRAGVVGFDPPLVEVAPGESTVFEVSVDSADFESFDTITMQFEPFLKPDLSWEYSQSFLDTLSLPPGPPCDFFCQSALAVGGTNFARWTAPVLVGTLTIDTTSLFPGEYEVRVNSSQEEEAMGFALSGLGSGFASLEPLEGVGKIIVTPEPTTLTIVFVGAIVAIRGRRSQ